VSCRLRELQADFRSETSLLEDMLSTDRTAWNCLDGVPTLRWDSDEEKMCAWVLSDGYRKGEFALRWAPASAFPRLWCDLQVFRLSVRNPQAHT
jgi:hypothetical protein